MDLSDVLRVSQNGLQELARLDARFLPFQGTLFAQDTLRADPLRMTTQELEPITRSVVSFLRLCDAHAARRATHKALEYILRRYHAHRLHVPHLLALFLPAVHLLGYRALMAAGGTDRVTAFFGTAPGGLIEAVQMGEEAGADVPMLTMLQFLRLILTLVLVPIGFTVLTGHAVGSAGGMEMTGSDVPLTPRDVAILAACAVAGAWIGVRLHLPAGWIFGPIVLSGAVHLAGITETVPPAWLVAGVQVVIGTGLGVRFAGMAPRAILRALRLAVLNVSITIAGAAAVAFALGPLVGESPASVFLAFAPGGLIEMSLIALSLQVSVVYVTVHHVARILLAVTLARTMAPWLLKPGRD
jgi:membrane AbrB-like protein